MSSAGVVGLAVDCAEVGLIRWSSMVVDFLHRLVLDGRLTASGSPLLQVILVLEDIIQMHGFER